VEQKGNTESSLQLNAIFLNIFPFSFASHRIPFLYSLNIILSKKGKEEKRKIATLLNCTVQGNGGLPGGQERHGVPFEISNMKIKRSFLLFKQHVAAVNGEIDDVQKVNGLMGVFRLIVSVYTSFPPLPEKKRNRRQRHLTAGDLDKLANGYV
jgi:hypothetical protein